MHTAHSVYVCTYKHVTSRLEELVELFLRLARLGRLRTCLLVYCCDGVRVWLLLLLLPTGHTHTTFDRLLRVRSTQRSTSLLGLRAVCCGKR